MENASARYEGISVCWIEKCTFISGIVAMALEARAGRHVHPDDPLLMDHQPLGLVALPPAFATVRRLGLGLLLHPARPDRGPARHALERRNLRPQVRNRLLQGGVLRQQAFGQGLKVAARQAGKGGLIRNGHISGDGTGTYPNQPRLASYLPGLLPRVRSHCNLRYSFARALYPDVLLSGYSLLSFRALSMTA